MKTVLKENATNALGKIVSMITQDELTKWPPPCIGYFYEPELPILPTKHFNETYPKSN